MDTLLIGFGHKLQMGKDTAINNIFDAFAPYIDIGRYGIGKLVRAEVPVLKYLEYGKEVQYIWCSVNKELNLRLQIPEFSEPEPLEYRLILQRYGAYKRSQDERYWIRRLQAQIEADKLQVALISSIRMKNEVGWLRRHGGLYVRVTREGWTNPDATSAADITENDLNDVQPDYELLAPNNSAGAKAVAIAVFANILQQHAPELYKTWSHLNDETRFI